MSLCPSKTLYSKSKPRNVLGLPPHSSPPSDWFRLSTCSLSTKSSLGGLRRRQRVRRTSFGMQALGEHWSPSSRRLPPPPTCSIVSPHPLSPTHPPVAHLVDYLICSLLLSLWFRIPKERQSKATKKPMHRARVCARVTDHAASDAAAALQGLCQVRLEAEGGVCRRHLWRRRCLSRWARAWPVHGHGPGTALPGESKATARTQSRSGSGLDHASTERC
jgi:hypothetical protein